MTEIPARLRRAVIARAENRCEYCQLSQFAQEASFHIDHVRPQSAGGKTELANLALACVSCSLRKAARLLVLDPLTNKEVEIFQPRQQLWREHFCINGSLIAGLTATGRGTVLALAMNRTNIVDIREEEISRGRFPPIIKS